MNKEELKIKAEEIYKQLDIEYENIEFEDDNDLNYALKINSRNYGYKIGIIDVFEYFSIEENEIVNIFGKIYTIKEDDNILEFYELVNQINIQLDISKLVISDNTITYISRIKVDKGWEYLNRKIVNESIICFFENIYGILRKIKILKGKNNE